MHSKMRTFTALLLALLMIFGISNGAFAVTIRSFTVEGNNRQMITIFIYMEPIMCF